MTNPWDRPTLAKHGNAERPLYEAIGRTLMAWEEVEGALAHLYSSLVAGWRHNTVANREYGEPLNFAQRADGLKAAANRHFIKQPSQDVEGTFCELICLAAGWSNRRNDVAHGRARPSSWIIKDETKGLNRWCLIPPHFRGTKFTNGKPDYILSSREIMRFGEAFLELARRIEAFAHAIEQDRLASPEILLRQRAQTAAVLDNLLRENPEAWPQLQQPPKEDQS